MYYFLTYLSRLPNGFAWVNQYLDTGIGGFFFIQALNAITWGSVLAFSSIYSKPALLLLPAIFGFGFSAKWHFLTDLASDPQASFALIFIPIHSILYVGIGGLIGIFIEKIIIRKTNSKT